MPVAIQRQQFAIPERWLWIAGGIAVLWIFGPKLIPALTRSAAESAGTIIVDSATGFVVGVGKAVGIPETDAARCEQAVAEGRWLDASFDCPAGTYVKTAIGAVYDTVTGALVGTTEPGAAEIIEIVSWEESGLAEQVLPIEAPAESYEETSLETWEPYR